MGKDNDQAQLSEELATAEQAYRSAADQLEAGDTTAQPRMARAWARMGELKEAIAHARERSSARDRLAKQEAEAKKQAAREQARRNGAAAVDEYLALAQELQQAINGIGDLLRQAEVLRGVLVESNNQATGRANGDAFQWELQSWAGPIVVMLGKHDQAFLNVHGMDEWRKADFGSGRWLQQVEKDCAAMRRSFPIQSQASDAT